MCVAGSDGERPDSIPGGEKERYTHTDGHVWRLPGMYVYLGPHVFYVCLLNGHMISAGYQVHACLLGTTCMCVLNGELVYRHFQSLLLWNTAVTGGVALHQTSKAIQDNCTT